MDKNIIHDARLSIINEASEYRDILMPFDFYDEFEAEIGRLLKQYIQTHLKDAQIIKVLEVGPGTGVTTLEILKTDQRVNVVAVDAEINMIDIARAKVSTESDFKNRVKFIHTDILTFLESAEDNSYDAFASVYTLHNFDPDYRRKVIGLIADKLKPGGIFINGDKYARAEEDHKKDFASEMKTHDKFDIAAKEAGEKGDTEKASYWRRLKEEGIQHAYKDEKTKITVDEQNALFKELGFINIKWGKRYDLVTTVSALKV